MLVAALTSAGCQAASSHRPLPPAPRSLQLVSRGGVPEVLIDGGEFLMGDGRGDAGPQHRVRLAAFVMDKYEVTQEQLADLQIPDASHFKDPQRPVEMIRWSEAVQFCNARSLQDGLEPCYDETTFHCEFAATGYRLPTEAEWEYAARAGGALQWEGDAARAGASSRLNEIACYGDNAPSRTQRVGSLQANPLGLHDLLGNVAEWCQDRYAEDYYAQSPAEDPRGPEQGDLRVLRGGSWKSAADDVSPFVRQADAPGIDDACFARDSYGFRCVRRPSPDELEQLGE